MNYYIQGDAAKADKIKAAFEELGYKTIEYCFNANRTLYFTFGGAIKTATYEPYKSIIITHPDYKELELPVEPKFKVGDWVVSPNGSQYLIAYIDKEDDRYLFEINEYTGEPMHYEDIQVVDGQYHHWTIQDAKDGDVLVTTTVRSCPFIYRKTSYKNNLAYYYVGINGNGDLTDAYPKNTLCHFGLASDVVPATKEQRDLLFKKMKEAGYTWDKKKKELKKNHYNIANFEPKQWVLVRDDDEWEWALTRFSYLSNGSASLFVCINGASFQQCIPFEGNEHLLGTTDMCDEMYINW